MFIQLHTLTSYHASLINRDETGSAKRITFGGAPRIRISSQCLKRHWREHFMADEKFASAVRSCNVFEERVLQLAVEKGADEEGARIVLRAVVGTVIKGAFPKEKSTGPLSLKTAQAVLIGEREAECLAAFVAHQLARWKNAEDKADRLVFDNDPAKAVEQVEKFLKKLFKGSEEDDAKGTKVTKSNLAALLGYNGEPGLMSGVEAAMFGRFVTSDLMARTDSAVSVAHAFTTHSAVPEIDFFSVVDDLASAEQMGASMVGESELNGGLFYGYVVIDVPHLVSNLTGCRPQDWREQDLESTRATIAKLIELIATVSPGAKTGSTAPFAYASVLVAEVGDKAPTALSNAFLKPVKGTELLDVSVQAMGNHMTAIEKMYGARGTRHVMCDPSVELPGLTDSTKSLPEVISSVLADLG